jgi:zinc transport system ATP-binding protein
MQIDRTKNIVEVKHLDFGYRTDIAALENVSFSVHPGDYIGLVGPNGGGKSTLLKAVLGLIKPQAGTIKLFGKNLHDFNDWSKIGYISQRATHFEANFPITVEEVVSMGRPRQFRLLGLDNAADKLIIERALEDVEMLDFKHQLISNLSGGQQQRIFIARALAGQPQIIFLDEPTTGVDTSTQQRFYALLRKLNREHGLTLVLVSHDIDTVAREATGIAFLNKKLTYFDDPRQFMDSNNLKKLFGEIVSLPRAIGGH